MILGSILRLVLLGLGVVLLCVVTWWAATCNAERGNADRPPAEIAEKETIDLVEDSEPAGRWSITEGRAPVVRRGRAPAKEPEATATEEFATAVLDSTGADSIALLPQVRAWRDGDRGGLAVVDSRRQWQAEEFDCKEGRRWEAGTRADGTMYSNCERALTGWLPDFAKDAAICGATGLAGWGIAKAVDYSEPVLVGGVAASGCVLLRVVG